MMPRPIRGGLSPQAVSRFGFCENQAAVRDEKALHQRAQPKANDLRENVKQRSQKPAPLGGGDKTSLQFLYDNKNKKGSEEIDNAES